MAEAERLKIAQAKMVIPMEEKLAGTLVSAFQKVHRGQARTGTSSLGYCFAVDARCPLLRAPRTGGKLPKALADIPVPLPVDPFSGKPFIYKLEGETAVLQGTPPKGEEKTAAFNTRYEVTIKK